MTHPNGIRTESTRTPSASRAGALHSHIHSHLHRQIIRPKVASIVTVCSAGWALPAETAHPDAATMDGGFAEIRGVR